MKKEYKPEDMIPSPLSVKLPNHVVRDIQEMARNTKLSVDDLVGTALKMFIATHNDYLGKRK